METSGSVGPMTPRIRPIAVALVLMLAAAACSSGSTVDTALGDAAGATTSTAQPDTGAAESVEGKPVVEVPDGPAPTELVIDDLVVGDGDTARAGDYLAMHYVGVLHADGVEFDASWNRGQTLGFTLGSGRVIQGWDQGIEGMQVGGRRLLSIPPDLAYGSQPPPGIPADAALVFVVDLLDVVTPPTVENAAEPVTELEVEVLAEGDGTTIAEGMFIETHYVIVLQTTGEVVDSSWRNGGPITIQIGVEPSQSLPAWDRGLIGLSAGDHVRMVIPPDLGFGDRVDIIPPDATIVTELNILNAG